jgi:hypothetical protein
VIFATVLAGWFSGQAQELRWRHLSSATGDLPLPGRSTQQTGAMMADLNVDGLPDILDKPYSNSRSK